MPDDFLEHYGVKGMKWGIRHDAPNSHTKSRHRMNLEERYIKKGFGKSDAEQAASKRLRTEKIIAGIGATTVAAALAYMAYNKYSQEFIDKTLTKDIKFTTITTEHIRNPFVKNVMSEQSKKDADLLGLTPKDFLNRQRFYASYKDRDTRKYLSEIGQNYLKGTASNPGKAYFTKVTTSGLKDIKIASRSKAEKVFSSLYKNDESFRNAVDSSLFRVSMDKGITNKQFKLLQKAREDLKQGRMGRRAYDAFNVALIDKHDSFRPSTQKFYDALKKHGYSAIADLNDSHYSGLKTKSPVIIFDPMSIKLDAVELITRNRLDKILKKK